MKFYKNVYWILMFVGFASLAAGVFLSVSHNPLTYAFVGIGLILYITGRIGVHFSAKKAEREEYELDGK